MKKTKFQDTRTRQEKARDMRWKRPALESLGSPVMFDRLEEIETACDDVRYFMDSEGETLLDALDGDEEEAFEFQMMFADLAADASRLREQLSEQGFDEKPWLRLDPNLAVSRQIADTQ